MLQAVSDTVQETVGRREALLAEVRRAEERLAALDTNRSLVQELAETRTKVTELTEGLDELRSLRVGLLLDTERSLRDALELRESLIAEILDLQHRRDALAAEVGGVSTGGPTRAEARSVESAAVPPSVEAEAASEQPSGVGEPGIEPAAVESASVPLGFGPRARSRHGWTAALAYALVAILAVVVFALAVLLTPLPNAFGWGLYAVQGGSMEPTIPAGAVVAARPAGPADLRVGDVITFADQNQPDVRVTHRVVGLDERAGRRVAITKGDANSAPDASPVPTDTAIGRVQFYVPYLGSVMTYLSAPIARNVVLAVAILALLLSVWPRGRPAKAETAPASEDPSRDDSPPRPSRRE